MSGCGRFLGLHCIQGSVALTDQQESDGCFQGENTVQLEQQLEQLQ